MSREDLASVLAQVSQELSRERDESVTAARICQLAVEVVDGCDHATLTVRSRRARLASRAVSSDVARSLQRTQLELEEGPSVEAFEAAEPVVDQDVLGGGQWPRWCHEAEVQGVRSVIAVPLVSQGRTQAVMTLYSHRLRTWTGTSYDVALLFATHAAAALDAAKVITGLESALGTRHQIGVAQGILMERHRLTVRQAFTVLQRYSSSSNERLSQVAAQVVSDVEATAGRPADGVAVPDASTDAST